MDEWINQSGHIHTLWNITSLEMKGKFQHVPVIWMNLKDITLSSHVTKDGRFHWHNVLRVVKSKDRKRMDSYGLGGGERRGLVFNGCSLSVLHIKSSGHGGW